MPANISKTLKRYVKIFKDADEANINEAETSLRIGKLFEDVLGYDIFTEISKEHIVKDRCVDYAIKVKGKVMFLIEAKRAGIKLTEKHIEQASNYAANSGDPWVLLTNGHYWRMYHLTFDEGIQADLIWKVDLIEDDFKKSVAKIALLHRKNIVKGKLDAYHAQVKTLSPKSIVQAIYQEDTLRTIRRHLKKMSGISVAEEDLVEKITAMLSKETWEEIGSIKVKKKRKAPKPQVKKATPSVPIIEQTNPEAETVAAEVTGTGEPTEDGGGF